MTVNSDSAPALNRRQLLHGAVVAFVLGAGAFASVLLLMMLDRVQVARHEELAKVEFGTPFNWVTQRQALDPPLPYNTSFISPLENPTSTHLLPFVVDVLLVWLLLTAMWGLVRVLRSRPAPK